jgi:hypothetical protein
MDASQKLGSFAARVCCFTVVAFLLTGCFGTTSPVKIRIKSETELAVAAIKTEWLIRCKFLASAPPNEVGALLQDYADMATAFAECQQRQNSFIEYMEPIVKKEREGATNSPPAYPNVGDIPHINP